MHQILEGSASHAHLNLSVSPSNGSTRKVRLSDRELIQRVQRVAIPEGRVELGKLSSKRGWRRVRVGVTHGMKVHFRVLRAPSRQCQVIGGGEIRAQISELLALVRAPSRQCQVIGGGEIRAQISELLALVRAPSESESNALLRALYGSHFIYTSLLHAIPNTDRGSLPPSPGTNIAGSGQQLMVRTASFAHKGWSFSPQSSTPVPSTSVTTSQSRDSSHRAKNEQCCYIEFLTPTQEGFKLSFCTLDAADVLVGKAPSDRVVPLHPISGWLIAEPSSRNPETLRITFQAAFLGNVPGGCDSRIAQDRLLFLARGVCRLEKVLRRRRKHHRQQRTTPGRVWQAILHPFRAMGVVDSEDERCSGGTHRNWHCIVCTRSFLPTLSKNWRRCDLCAYRVCDEPACCNHERVTIYNRYVAPLSVCARCRECIDDREGDHVSTGNLMGSSTGDVRYTGVSLRFADRESELEPEFEVDPSDRNHGRWGSNGTRRSTRGVLPKRKAQSDPPPMLGLAFSSSGDDSSSPVWM